MFVEVVPLVYLRCHLARRLIIMERQREMEVTTRGVGCWQDHTGLAFSALREIIQKNTWLEYADDRL